MPTNGPRRGSSGAGRPARRECRPWRHYPRERAIGKVYSKARKAQGQNELLDELLASPPAVDPKRVQGQGDIGTASRDRLREALVILSERRARRMSRRTRSSLWMSLKRLPRRGRKGASSASAASRSATTRRPRSMRSERRWTNSSRRPTAELGRLNAVRVQGRGFGATPSPRSGSKRAVSAAGRPMGPSPPPGERAVGL